jgi:tetratricopeptide (TPR) repeat protein
VPGSREYSVQDYIRRIDRLLTGSSRRARRRILSIAINFLRTADAHLSVAYAFEQLKDTPAAVKELKLTLELKPDTPAAENDLAWIYATAADPKFRDPAAALVLARHAVLISPQLNPVYLDTLAEALLLNGQPAEALANELQAAKLDPRKPRTPIPPPRLPRSR